MVIMAGMLPGVECARRRRVRQSSSSSSSGAADARRASLCLYAGAGRDLGGSSSSSWSSAASYSSSKERSGGACSAEATVARAWALGGSAREARERLDQKLRGQRQPVVVVAKRHSHQSAGTDGDSSSLHRSCVLRREVLPRKGGRRDRFGWCRRLGVRRGPAPAEAEAAEAKPECAVCLEELRAGDVVARLPCAHRFHWPCAVPWVQAASRCPVCRAHVHLDVADLAAGPSS